MHNRALRHSMAVRGDSTCHPAAEGNKGGGVRRVAAVDPESPDIDIHDQTAF